MKRLIGVKYAGPASDSVSSFVREIEKIIEDPRHRVGKARLVGMIAGLVPEFRHAKRGRTLDDRM